MLAWMESRPLPFAFTTNLMDRMDKASHRRFAFKIKFGYLTPRRAGLAFKHFFGAARRADLENLTPADFALAAKKASILRATGEEELYELLRQEAAAKGGKLRQIGFSG
jgi:hypothetical protein